MNPNFPDIPGFTVEAELGRGGMGVVYRVQSQASGATLALKMILGGRSAGFLELARFRIEAEALACLNHPNIVKIRHVGVFAGYPFFAMDFAERGTLKQVARGRPQPARRAAEMVRTLALAIQHAHGRGMLHRDLKPANVLLMADGTPKVSDFGLVKFTAPIAKVSESCCTMPMVSELDFTLQQFAEQFAALYRPVGNGSEEETTRQMWEQCAERTGVLSDETRLKSVREFLTEAKQQEAAPALDDLTRTGTVMGSPVYMAPEQATGSLDRIGPATDVYALGGILYELLTGQPALNAKGVLNVLAQVTTQGPRPPSEVNPFSPAALDEICLKCMEKAPERRYRRAQDLADALQRFLDTTPDAPAKTPEDGASQGGVRPGECETTRLHSEQPRRTWSWWPFGRRK